MPAFLDRVLDPPSYGLRRDGNLYIPTKKELLGEFFSRLDPLTSRKHWLSFLSWAASSSLAIPFVIFLFYFFSWKLLFISMIYSMVALGTHGTIYLHRYSTHRAFHFRNSFARFLVRNLVIKIVPEETYVVSHHVHHYIPEQPGDPYNVHAGWLYCFLADVNHQQIARELSEKDYERVAHLLDHTGVHRNTYAQYRKWGSICHPLYTLMHYGLNWAFWYGTFYGLGGHALATAIFGLSGVWAFGVRTYNFDGHGRGVDKRQTGIDFNGGDFSINQIWPGYVAGEWHNNHHLYPNGARSGFLPYQLDLAWVFIRFYSALGGIRSYRDYRIDFYRDHYDPYLKKRALLQAAIPPAPVPS